MISLRHVVLAASLAAILLLPVVPASAAIIAVSGDVVALLDEDIPDTLRLNRQVCNDNIVLFPEQKDVALTRRVQVDMSEPGTYDHPSTIDRSFIPAGARVDSYFIHAEKVGRSQEYVNYSGSITFDTDIIGVIITRKNLQNSNSQLGHDDVLYGWNLQKTGLELGRNPYTRDSITISEDRRTLHIDYLNVNTARDQIRILTLPSLGSDIPEPATMLLLGIGGLVLCRRRRR